MPKFTTKDGYLTFYAMACGYLEVNQEWKGFRKVVLELKNPELNLYTIDNLVTGQHFYTQNIADARFIFNRECKIVGTKRTINKGSPCNCC